MSSVVQAITKFQNVALIATAGAVAYYYAHESERPSSQDEASSNSGENNAISGTKRAHDLSGQTVDKDKQGFLAKAVDTDCEYCLDTRRKLFGLFGAAGKEAESKSSK